MSGKNVVEFTEANFDAEVLKSQVPVLVDFWAEWCGPCKIIGPIIEAVAAEFTGRIKTGKVNVDNAPALASRYSVTSIPTLLFVKNGGIVSQHVGALPQKALIAKIEQFLLQ